MKGMRNDQQLTQASGFTRRDFLSRAAVVAGGLTVGGPLLAACGSDPGAGGGGGGGSGPVKVGALLDGTGPLSLYGEPMVKAQTFMIEELNANGGLLGRQLELRYIDSKSQIPNYVAGARELVADEDVVVTHGGITSASREAIRPVFDQAKKLYFYNQLYEGGVCDKWVFCTGVVPQQQMKHLIPYLAEVAGKRFYTMAADYNYGQISAEWVRKFVEDIGGQVVGEEFIPLDQSNFNSSLARIQAAKPDVVLSLLVGGAHLGFYNQFAQAGLKDDIALASTVVGLGNEQQVLSPDVGEGLIVAMPYFQELDTPASKAFAQAWEKRWPGAYINDEVNSVVLGYRFWAAGVEKAGSFERDAVIKALESGLTIDAPEGEVLMDPVTHHVHHAVSLAQINRNKGFDIIKSFPPDTSGPVFDRCDLIENPDTHTQLTEAT